jgi:hypothetical protein
MIVALWHIANCESRDRIVNCGFSKQNQNTTRQTNRVRPYQGGNEVHERCTPYCVVSTTSNNDDEILCDDPTSDSDNSSLSALVRSDRFGTARLCQDVLLLAGTLVVLHCTRN